MARAREARVSRRDNAANRCVRCRLHQSLCVCALIPRLETRTRLLLIIHRFEDRKPTNTGRLAAECLPNSEVLVRGHRAAPSVPLTFDPATRPLLLFPDPDATPLAALDQSDDARPITLIVPDGTWRQASRVRSRVPGLQALPCVYLPEGAASEYRLRSESHVGGLATLEAIARAFGLLESREVQLAIERVFGAMVERTRWARGELASTELRHGLPAGVLRHDPRSGSARS
jgi:DTW domain-containing protein